VLAGGANAVGGTPVYDAGTVTASVGGFNASASYAQGGNSTAAQMAAALAAALNAANSPVTATASGATVSLTYKTAGTAGNTTVTVSSSTSQTAYFSSASFTSSGTTLAGGANAVPGSLATPYVTLYGYDTLGNLLCVEQHGNNTTGTGCSAAASNDATSPWRVRRFTYDSLSRLLTATNPESGAISYSYDADGNLLQKTSPAPNVLPPSTATQTISYCYDALHRVTGKAYGAQSCPLTSPVVSYTYDVGTNGIGHLTSLTDQAGSGSYTYDVMGRVATESRTINPGASLAAVTKNMSYAYNLDGSLKSLTYPSNATVTYTPDSAGRMVSAIDTGNGINYATSATYGPDGSLTGFISGNTGSFAGITNKFLYTPRLQPCRMIAATGGALPASCTDSSQGNVLDLGYDFHLGNGDNGNVWGITNNKDNTRNQTFTYDALNRLTSAQNTGTDCSVPVLQGKTKFWGNSYGYDAWGNLLQKTVTKCGAENLSVTAAANNQLQGGYVYDAAGNMTHDATANLNYSYDQENRITGAGGYVYTYDDDGNRVEKSSAGTGTLYWYMSPGIVAESDLLGNLQSEYVFFDGERVARKDFPGLAVSYYFSDHLKTTDVVTDAQGNIKNESDFYPWGGELQFSNNDSNHYKFTGKERDAETQLDYFGARYYGSSLGRFVQADPLYLEMHRLSDPQLLNLYAYVRNNPLSLTDPTGMLVNVNCQRVSSEQCGQTVTDFNNRDGAQFQVTRDDKTGQLNVVDPQNVDPTKLSGGEKALYDAITKTDVTGTLTVVGKDSSFDFEKSTGKGQNSLDRSDLNALGGADKRLPGEVIAHAALESYDSAKPGVSVDQAHDFASGFFGFKYGLFTPNFGKTVDTLGLNWRATRLHVDFRAQMKVVTPIPMDSFNKLRNEEKVGTIPRDVKSVEILQPK
jgi:RHS repeat-associated protein